MSTETRFRIFADLYKDSVALMQLGATLRQRPGIAEASCIMATPANLAQLAHAGLAIEADVHPSDLLIVVRGARAACDEAIEAACAMLQQDARSATIDAHADFAIPITSIAAAVEQAPDADLALISVPGDYAAAEALKALSAGLHVMLFSDNVPVEDEREIKRYAASRGLLVMGPDCGTAIVNGVPLGFANVVRRGDIGLVAASGTGLQEVACRVHNLGGGVSQAIGTGGRDLRDDVGGLTMLAGVQALAGDDGTRVIVLISKPPSPVIASRILDAVATAGKPAVVHFLGADAQSLTRAGVRTAQSLAHAADVAIALAHGRDAPDAVMTSDVDHAALLGLLPSQRNVLGLMSGGTFCYEAQLAFLAHRLACRSNAPVHGAQPLESPAAPHAFIDLGDDEYTRGRPHPMIDPSLRDAKIRAAATDPSIAIVLVDVVLGYGAHPDPAEDLARALRDAQAMAAANRRRLLAIAHVCGTDLDPQNRARQQRVLASSGAIVCESNIEAATLAARFALRLAGGGR